MKKLNFHYFPRDFEAGDIIENFLVSAVSSLLLIRLFLAVFKYPQIVPFGTNFHIAHMLLGGFLMIFSLILLFVFLNRETKYIASIIGGIGFGAFIDELGKFITNDNNYFYEPTVALIYVVFVIIFLSARAFERFFKPTKQEYAINALEIAKQIVMHDLNVDEKQRALYLLNNSNHDIPIVKMLSNALQAIKASSTENPGPIHRLKDFFSNTYIRLTHSRLFILCIMASFIIISILNFINALISFNSAQTFAEWGEVIFSFISGLTVFLGVQLLWYKRSRKVAYEMFKFAILISIFLTQFFRFLHTQFAATYILLLSLVVLSVLQYLIYRESTILKVE